MLIEDQIRDEKLQYDINRESANISALPSGKIDTYGYFTGEETLPSNQQQMIEQTKFTYSPLRKAFEKQTKAIENQGKKHIDALETLQLKGLKPKETKETKPKETNSIEYSDCFLNGLDEIRKNNQLIFLDLTCNFKSPNIAPISFIKFKDPNRICQGIHDGGITLEDVEKQQIKFKSDLGHINQGPRYKELPIIKKPPKKYNKKY